MGIGVIGIQFQGAAQFALRESRVLCAVVQGARDMGFGKAIVQLNRFDIGITL